MLAVCTLQPYNDKNPPAPFIFLIPINHKQRLRASQSQSL